MRVGRRPVRRQPALVRQRAVPTLGTVLEGTLSESWCAGGRHLRPRSPDGRRRMARLRARRLVSPLVPLPTLLGTMTSSRRTPTTEPPPPVGALWFVRGLWFVQGWPTQHRKSPHVGALPGRGEGSGISCRRQ